MPIKNQKISLEADLDRSAALRDFTKKFFEQAGFDAAGTNRLVLVADEIFMNAVKYGCTQTDTVDIEISIEDEIIRVAITDGGHAGITADQLREKIKARKNHNPNQTSGRGLALITEKWTDGYTISQSESGAITVTFEKKIEAADHLAAKKPSKLAKLIKRDGKPENTFKIAGEIDESNLSKKFADAKKLIDNEKTKNCTLDFGEVSFITSAVIGQIASWSQTLEARGGQLTIENATPFVFEIFELVGLDRIIPISVKN